MKLKIKELTVDDFTIVGLEPELETLGVCLEYDDDDGLVLNLDPYIMHVYDTVKQLDDEIKNIKLCMRVISFLEDKGFEYYTDFQDADEGCANLFFEFAKEDLELINP